MNKKINQLQYGVNMKNRFRAGSDIIAGIYLILGDCISAPAQTHSHVPNTAPKETIMTTRASGTFEVKLTPSGGGRSI